MGDNPNQERKILSMENKGMGQEVARVLMAIQSNVGKVNRKMLERMDTVGRHFSYVSGSGRGEMSIEKIDPMGPRDVLRSSALGSKPYLAGEHEWERGELVLQIEYMDLFESTYKMVLVGEEEVYFIGCVEYHSPMGRKIRSECWGRYDVLQIERSSADGGVCWFTVVAAVRESRNAGPIRTHSAIRPAFRQHEIAEVSIQQEECSPKETQKYVTAQETKRQFDDFEFENGIEEILEQERHAADEIVASLSVAVVSVFYLFKVLDVNVSEALRAKHGINCRKYPVELVRDSRDLVPQHHSDYAVVTGFTGATAWTEIAAHFWKAGEELRYTRFAEESLVSPSAFITWVHRFYNVTKSFVSERGWDEFDQFPQCLMFLMNKEVGELCHACAYRIGQFREGGEFGYSKKEYGEMISEASDVIFFALRLGSSVNGLPLLSACVQKLASDEIAFRESVEYRGN